MHVVIEINLPRRAFSIVSNAAVFLSRHFVSAVKYAFRLGVVIRFPLHRRETNGDFRRAYSDRRGRRLFDLRQSRLRCKLRGRGERSFVVQPTTRTRFIIIFYFKKKSIIVRKFGRPYHLASLDHFDECVIFRQNHFGM